MAIHFLLLLMLLGPILLVHAGSKEQDKDNLHDTDDLLNTYLPVNELTPNLEMVGSLPQKIQMRDTVFNVAFNAAKCNTGKSNTIPANHTVIVTFLEDWSSEKLLNSKDLYKNAFVISRLVDVEQRWMTNTSFRRFKIWTREYPYKLEVYHHGHLESQVNPFYRFSMYNADFQLLLDQDSATIMKRRYPSENYAYENFMNFDEQIRYVAIFANYMDRCETFISAVGNNSKNDSSYPFWVRKLGLPENLGLSREPKGDSQAESAIHYVQFAFFVVFLFTVLLSKVLVPTYMDLTDGDSETKVNILNLNYEDNETADVDEKPPTSGRESLAPAAEASQRDHSTQQQPTTAVPTPSNILPTPQLTRNSPGDKPEKTQDMSMSKKRKEKANNVQAEKTQEESSRKNSRKMSVRNTMKKPKGVNTK